MKHTWPKWYLNYLTIAPEVRYWLKVDQSTFFLLSATLRCKKKFYADKHGKIPQIKRKRSAFFFYLDRRKKRFPQSKDGGETFEVSKTSKVWDWS